jgi:urea transporter
LYVLGGKPLVDLYQWWNALPIAAPIKTYLLSLSAIFFHYSVLAGLLVAVGLLFYSRIAFTLSLLGFFTALLAHK